MQIIRGNARRFSLQSHQSSANVQKKSYILILNSDFSFKGPLIRFEFVHKFLLAAAEISITQAVKTLAVVKFRQMREFMAYYIIAQLGREKHIHV